MRLPVHLGRARSGRANRRYRSFPGQPHDGRLWRVQRHRHAASGHGAHLARPENIAACQPRAYGGGYGHLRRHPHLSRHFDGPCRHGRGQRHLRGNRLHRSKPHRRPFARRLGNVECGAGLQRIVRLRPSRRAHAAQRYHLAAGVLGARRRGMRRVRGHSAHRARA